MPASNAVPLSSATQCAPVLFIGWRVVATPTAIDTLVGHTLVGPTTVVRIAPDECIIAPASGSRFAATIQPDDVLAATGDEHAIVEEEAGFTAWRMTANEANHVLRPLLEWELPATGPYTAQGFVKMVPVKVVATAANDLTVFFPTCYSHEMLDRVR